MTAVHFPGAHSLAEWALGEVQSSTTEPQLPAGFFLWPTMPSPMLVLTHPSFLLLSLNRLQEAEPKSDLWKGKERSRLEERK